MRFAILSAGPSLRQTFDPSAPFEERIAVNSAAAVHPCGWWCCGDAQTFDRVAPPADWPVPVLFTVTESDSHFRRRQVTSDRFDRHRLVLWGPVGRRVGAPNESLTWSITAAIVLAVDLGAREIDVYGHDTEWQDPQAHTDVLGHQLGRRVEIRDRMIADWHTTTRWAAGLGVRVREHTPEVPLCV